MKPIEKTMKACRNRRNYKNSGKMFGQTFNPGGASCTPAKEKCYKTRQPRQFQFTRIENARQKARSSKLSWGAFWVVQNDQGRFDWVQSTPDSNENEIEWNGCRPLEHWILHLPDDALVGNARFECRKIGEAEPPQQKKAPLVLFDDAEAPHVKKQSLHKHAPGDGWKSWSYVGSVIFCHVADVCELCSVDPSEIYAKTYEDRPFWTHDGEAEKWGRRLQFRRATLRDAKAVLRDVEAIGNSSFAEALREAWEAKGVPCSEDFTFNLRLFSNET